MQARDWLSQRDYLDLDAQAERALRAAGAAFQNDVVAERWLDEAAALAADHPAVLLAHYRYYLYKHRYEEAEHFARRCLAQVARELGLPSTLLDTCASDADFSATEPRVRYWLFGMQAWHWISGVVTFFLCRSPCVASELLRLEAPVNWKQWADVDINS